MIKLEELRAHAVQFDNTLVRIAIDDHIKKLSLQMLESERCEFSLGIPEKVLETIKNNGFQRCATELEQQLIPMKNVDIWFSIKFSVTADFGDGSLEDCEVDIISNKLYMDNEEWDLISVSEINEVLIEMILEWL